MDLWYDMMWHLLCSLRRATKITRGLVNMTQGKVKDLALQSGEGKDGRSDKSSNTLLSTL